METILINFKNGDVQTHEVWTSAITGEHLILVTKQGELNENDSSDAYLLTTTMVLDLKDITNYTVKTKTKKYDQK